jgi:thiol-disulfide isomerase/thioredoxin
MKRFILLFFSIAVFTGVSKAQVSYDIKINLKNCPDTTVYLVKYIFDQQYIADTCKKVRNGAIEFKGKTPLDKGMYALVSTGMLKYFDFFVDESERFIISGNFSDLANTLKSSDSKENELMFSYARFMTAKEQEYKKLSESEKEKQKAITAEVKKYTETFMQKNKGSFVVDFLNLREEKYARDVPKASNGRPDSIYQYYYYKSHYLDGINFKDERIIRVPFFGDRVKKYISDVIVQHPDTIIKELDRILGSCSQDNLVYNLLLGHFTYKYEQNKVMSFDRNGKCITFEKVFVHLADTYITPGKAKEVYTDETVARIREKANIIRNLLPESRVPELFMIDTTNAARVRKMGFDTASSGKSLTDLYYKNIERLTPMFKTLYQVNAKYTVLVFWAVDCDHCKKEVPKLSEGLKELKGKVDVKVFAVQTKDDMIDDWRKFIIQNKLDFIHVCDPVHLNNTKETFDINSTPVIYLLDREKKIKGKKLTAEQVVEIIKNLENIEKP